MEETEEGRRGTGGKEERGGIFLSLGGGNGGGREGGMEGNFGGIFFFSSAANVLKSHLFVCLFVCFGELKHTSNHVQYIPGPIIRTHTHVHTHTHII